MVQLATMVRKSPTQQFEVKGQSRQGNLVVVRGLKLPPPAKRIVLVCNDYRILKAKIFRLDKGDEVELAVTRINHLPTRGQVRLHTEETLFPGHYKLELETRP